MLECLMLQHRSPDTMTKHYHQAKQIDAAVRCPTTLQDLRERFPLVSRLNTR
jgi:hypothetical protein